jgi:hypothetical protein
MKERVVMSFKMKTSEKLIAPSLIQEILLEELIKSINNELLPHSTAREGGNCLKNNAPFNTVSPSFN